MTAPWPQAEVSFRDLEEKVGVEAGFFARLYDEDDWSFIIKLHALFEAACSNLLSFHFNEPELDEIFVRLELSGKIIGKTVFLGRLGLLGKEWRRFISALSELRNDLVHDIRQSNFKLEQYIQSLDSNALKSFAVAFSPYESILRLMVDFPFKSPEDQARVKKQSTIESVLERAKADPKAHIWFGAYSTLVHIAEMEGYSSYKQAVRARRTFGEDDVEA